MPARSSSRRILRLLIAAATLATLTSGCDSSLDRPTGPTAAVQTATPTGTIPSITPVTPDGLTTGPGVSDDAITIGLLVDPARDRGFSDGVELWQQAVNTSGGLCGRTVRLVAMGVDGVPTDVAGAYDAIGRASIGLITLASPADSAALNTAIAADQIPTLTSTGTSAQLGPGRPIVVGPTDDVLAINGLDYLRQSGKLEQGASVGVLTDGSASADNALRGARWWAREHGVTLDVREADPDAAIPQWGAATTVLALTDSAETARLALATAADVTILTTIDGYDPADWSAGALAAATAGRVLLSTAAPAYGSDYPAAVAVASRVRSRPATPGASAVRRLRHRAELGPAAHPGLRRPDADPPRRRAGNDHRRAGVRRLPVRAERPGPARAIRPACHSGVGDVHRRSERTNGCTAHLAAGGGRYRGLRSLSGRVACDEVVRRNQHREAVRRVCRTGSSSTGSPAPSWSDTPRSSGDRR